MSASSVPNPFRHRRSGGLAGLFAAGLAAGAIVVVGVANAGGSPEVAAVRTPPPAVAAPVAAAPAAAPAAAQAHDGHSGTAGADAGGAASHTGGAGPAARETPYGTEPMASRKVDGVREFRLTAAPTTWRTDDGRTHEAWAYNGQVPGPVIRGRVGERVRIVVTNNLPEATTIHWHGLNLPISEDGVPDISHAPIAPGASHTYTFDLREPGLFMYHPHFNTLSQQTKGLYGTFVVDPPEGPDPDVTEVFQILSEMGGRYLINGKSFPSTDAYTVPRGKPVLIRTVNVGEMDHPMHLHGFLFRVVGADGGRVPPAAQFDRYTQNVAPGEGYDLLFTPNEVGTWLFHCHILSHVTGPDGEHTGMVTTFKVTG